MNIPPMGRRKFTYNGKPHGRNELIKEYIWIAYCESLPPGAPRDKSMARGRKQVSSHIQVLKAFMRDHPACKFLFMYPLLSIANSAYLVHRLFPPPPAPKNGFEDSFKDDPCLRALAAGRLPRTHRQHRVPKSGPMPIVVVRPALFWLLMTSSSLSIEDRHRDIHEIDLYNEGLVSHKFTGLSVERSRASLESLPNWRPRFPRLQQLYNTNQLDCEIIHMEASLNLLTHQPPEGSELCSRIILSLSGRQDDSDWKIVTTLNKPPELYRDYISEPPIEEKTYLVAVTSETDTETRIKVPFPASTWAQAFSCLRNIQSKYEERQLHSFTDGMGHYRPASDFVNQITMYQEVQSSSPGLSTVRHAIIVWTFRQARDEHSCGTSWRYLDANTPARRACMSPSPDSSHRMQASMNENFNSWSDNALQLQPSSLLDPFGPGLATPPHTAGLQSSFTTPNYTYGNTYDLPGENLSFHSTTTNTIDSDVTLVDQDMTTNIENFLANAHVELDNFEPTSQAWSLPGTEAFDNDSTWANYTVPSTTPAAGWDSADAKNHAWPDIHIPTDGKSWAADGDTKDKEWIHVNASPSKESSNYIEQSIEQKLLPWIDSHRDEPKNTYTDIPPIDADMSQAQAQETHELKEQEWHDPQDEFDFAQLAALK